MIALRLTSRLFHKSATVGAAHQYLYKDCHRHLCSNDMVNNGASEKTVQKSIKGKLTETFRAVRGGMMNSCQDGVDRNALQRPIHRNIPAIQATPTTTLVDEVVNITLCGFDPGSKVTVRSYLPEPGQHFEAYAHFVVDDNGEVSVGADSAVGGSYTALQRPIHRNIPAIQATPTTTLVDEVVNITLCGFDPGSKVTVRSYLPEPGQHFEAYAHFVVDDNGEVSVGADSAVGGSYTALQRPIHRNIPAIQATPTTTLVDEVVNITLCGFDPGSKVTVRSYLPEPGQHFEAYAHFVVDDNGEVSVGADSAVGGSYTDVEPMGLFWGMTQSPGQRQGIRFTKKDVTKPMEVTLSVHKGHLNMSTLQTDTPLARKQIYRTYISPDVEIIKVHSGRIRGRVFKPKGHGPFQGVIDLNGISGGLLEDRAALLASRGFAVFALAYIKYEDLTTDMFDLDLEYFEEAVDWLGEQPYIQQGGIGVCGYCYGAVLATLMAATFHTKIKACCSISGSSVLTGVPMTFKGKQLQSLGVDFIRIKTVQLNPRIVNIFDTCDPLETAPAESIIELEKADNLLFFVGLDDLQWDTPGFIDGAERRLQALGCNNYEIVRYPKTGHIIDLPYAPITLTSYYGLISYIAARGGSPREHQRAQEDHWPRLLNFFKAHVGTKSP